MGAKSNHSWRELIYLHDPRYTNIHNFAAESNSARLNGRGGMGYLVSIDTEAIQCNCPAYGIHGKCWHTEEAPKALAYWTIRLKHGALSREEFDAFCQQWWPKHDPIMQRCRQQGEFKGRSEEQWTLFFAALLHEFNARTVAHGKLDRTFGKDLVDAVLNPTKEEAE